MEMITLLCSKMIDLHQSRARSIWPQTIVKSWFFRNVNCAAQGTAMGGSRLDQDQLPALPVS
jgi:hypothetical protein